MKIVSRKSRILFYSDCPFWGGCENMLVSIFNSPDMRQEFDINFVYRYSIEYEKGLHSCLKLKISEKPVGLLTFNSMLASINKFRGELVKDLLKFIVACAFIQYWLLFYNILRLFLVFRKTKPDIIYINNGGYPGAYSCMAAVFAAKMIRVKKIVFVVNNIVVPYNSFLRYIDKPIDKFVINNTTVFLTCSKYAGNKLRDLWNLPEEKVVNIPNTVESRPVIESKESVLKRLGVTKGQIILGNIALLEPRKGQRYLIKALANVKEKFDSFKNIKLIIVGTGKEEEYLKRLTAELNLGANIIFMKNDKNIFDIINIFDVFILSSLGFEDFPNVIVEAMSLGKPIIGTRVAGIPEQVEDGLNGFIVGPGDAEALSLAILTLIRDEKKRTEMGMKSRERFNSLFSYDKFINKYVNFFRVMSKI